MVDYGNALRGGVMRGPMAAHGRRRSCSIDNAGNQKEKDRELHKSGEAE
jgi:hypothetical protein